MVTLIEQNREALAGLCRRFNVRRLELFGSACTQDFDAEHSDLDFLVEYAADSDLGPWMKRLFELEDALSALFARKVDLVMPAALRNHWFRREADRTRTVVYDASEMPKVA